MDPQSKNFFYGIIVFFTLNTVWNGLFRLINAGVVTAGWNYWIAIAGMVVVMAALVCLIWWLRSRPIPPRWLPAPILIVMFFLYQGNKPLYNYMEYAAYINENSRLITASTALHSLFGVAVFVLAVVGYLYSSQKMKR